VLRLGEARRAARARGLLNVAEAAWAHMVAVLCLVASVLTGFRVITNAALDRRPASRRRATV
jgi:hypothetical protein